MEMVAVILAAGKGKRMKSELPKVLHPIAGRPMLNYVINAAKGSGLKRIIVVVSPKIKRHFTRVANNIELVVQREQLGTGHALEKATKVLRDYDGLLLVLCGDTPLITSSTLRAFMKFHQSSQTAASILTARINNPMGYGRIIRTEERVERIVEDKDASAEEKKVNEINTGIYCFEMKKIRSVLPLLKRENKQREFYLTDVVEHLNRTGEKVVSFETNEEEIIGVNSRKELAEVERVVRFRIIEKWMDKGVTFIDPSSTFVGAEVVIGKDTVLHPYTFLEGKTSIGTMCDIGPSVKLIDTKVGSKVKMQYAVVRESIIEDEASLGPFCSLRSGAEVKKGGKVGSFVEIKKSKIGEKSKVPHLSYVGDAIIGKNVNIGAGAVTCNYDGKKKHRTIIEDNVFIGSDTMLIAPVKIGKGAITGAGSVITKDVPPESLGLERAEQKNIKGWVKKRRKKK